MATITGTNGSETLNGTSADDHIVALDGDDVLNGGGGADEMEGGLGNDTYTVGEAGDLVIEAANAGNDQVNTTLSSYALTANVERLVYVGPSGAGFTGIGNGLGNYIEGWHGNDVLNGNAGADQMRGYDGDDSYWVDDAGDQAIETASNGEDRIYVTLAAFALPDHVERLYYEGPVNAAFTGTGNGLDNVIQGGNGADGLDGGAGADTLRGLGGNDSYLVDNAGDQVVEAAGAGTDLVYTSLGGYTLPAKVENLTFVGGVASPFAGTGNALPNILTGRGGNDILNGLAGADTMIGAAGDDTYHVDDAGDVVTELAGQGSDTVRTTRDTYALGANVERLIYVGASSADFFGVGNGLANYLEGWHGNDYLKGEGGADKMVGLGGDDRYQVDDAGDEVVEAAAAGNDRVDTTLAFYQLPVNVERLVYIGPVTGGFVGYGNNLDNEIEGWNGNDILDGLAGADTMIGLAGDDIYHVREAGDVVVEAAGGGTDSIVTTLTSYTLGDHFEKLSFSSNAAVAFTGTGNALDNRIEGRGGNDTLDGLAGADTLVGGQGNDHYMIDSSADIVVEAFGEGLDWVFASAAVYALSPDVEYLVYVGPSNQGFQGTGNAIGNAISGGAGSDTLDGQGGADGLTGGLGNDTYFVDDVGDVVTEQAGEGSDTIRTTLVSYVLPTDVERLVYIGVATAAFSGTGNGLDNYLSGRDGNDTLDGGGGTDIMVGGDGNDSYKVDSAGDQLFEAADEGTDTVNTTLASYVLAANFERLVYVGLSTANFTGTGNGLDNWIQGWSGNDVLDGKAGADMMVGGAGDDLYHVDNAGDAMVEAAGMGTDTAHVTIAAYTLPDGVERLLYFGNSLAAFAGTGNGLANYLEGWNGNDTLDGKTGADTMKGLLGNDIYVVDNALDIVVEGAGGGVDEVRTAIGSRADPAQMYVLPAHVENLTGTSGGAQGVFANALDNLVKMGPAGDLVVLHDGGADTVQSGGGNDFLYYGAAFTNADANDGGAGFDAVGLLGDYFVTFDADDLVGIEKLAVYSSGGPGSNDYNLKTIDANVAAGGKLTVVGQSLTANETLVFDGSAELDGAFNIRGGKGADTIAGGAGADRIWGNLGADTLTGGAGKDMFEYRSAAESTAAASDQILGFAAGDKILLGAIDADGNAANGNSSFAFIGAAAFGGVAGQLRAVQGPPGQWLVQGDTNGDGLADLSILVATADGHLLAAADFVL